MQDLPLRKISGIVSAIAFVADLITIILFIRDLVQGNAPASISSSLAKVVLIMAVFAFAFLLLHYSRQEFESLDRIVWIFGWLYISLSAALFGVISYYFIMEEGQTPGEFIGCVLLIGLITGLGSSVTLFVGERVDYFSIPFMLVALEQIVLWLFRIFSQRHISFNLGFIGNLLLFVYAGLIILFFILSFQKFQKKI